MIKIKNNKFIFEKLDLSIPIFEGFMITETESDDNADMISLMPPEKDCTIIYSSKNDLCAKQSVEKMLEEKGGYIFVNEPPRKLKVNGLTAYSVTYYDGSCQYIEIHFDALKNNESALVVRIGVNTGCGTAFWNIKDHEKRKAKAYETIKNILKRDNIHACLDMIEVSNIWDKNWHELWLEKEDAYSSVVISSNLQLEEELENFPVSELKAMNSKKFYDFLYNKYFVWKYTAKNRLATTRKQLAKYSENFEELNNIKERLVSFEPEDIKSGLEIAASIKGLGTAGASGLLSLLYPEYYGTVDQYVVLRLKEFEAFKNDEYLHKINPENLSIQNGVYLIKILQKKAEELNEENNITYWTPRKIDKVLWALNRK